MDLIHNENTLINKQMICYGVWIKSHHPNVLLLFFSDAFDHNRMLQALKDLAASKSTLIPKYNYISCAR